MLELLKAAKTYIEGKVKTNADTAIILGSGLNHIAENLEDAVFLDYRNIPAFPVSTAPGHKGRLAFGKLSGKDVICMQGRLHYYEGHCKEDIVFPIRLFKELGVKTLIVTNAAGGINENFDVGDIMLITDHINLTGTNPLIGKNLDCFGTRFPDMTYAYAPRLREKAKEAAEQLGIKLREGVYIGVTGPSFETPAEIRAFRVMGADAVGMSTVFEVIAAVHAGIEVLGFSLITNKAAGISGKCLSGEEVNEIGRRSGEKLGKLIETTVGEL